MRVSSPIGDLPFVPRRVTVSRLGIEIDGAMGAWPAQVNIDASDLSTFAACMPIRAASVGLVATGLVIRVLHSRKTAANPRRSSHV